MKTYWLVIPEGENSDDDNEEDEVKKFFA
jgi:hypothetical protein